MAEGRRPVIWSPNAGSDLADIWTYYLTMAGPHTADRILRGIGEVCRLLEDHPLAGRARNEVRPALRSIAAPPTSSSTGSQRMPLKSSVCWMDGEISMKCFPRANRASDCVLLHTH